MRVVIEGHRLPGRSWWSDGEQLSNVHVGPQVGRDVVEPVPGDAPSARWEFVVRVVDLDGGGRDLRGPAVHGRRGERFLYLSWGDVGDDGGFQMFRRAKLMLDRVDPVVMGDAVASDALVARVDLTDERGCPRCARVDPPAVEWRAG